MQLFIVTGASRGLGRALAQACLQRPEAQVLALSRSGTGIASAQLKDLHFDLADTEQQIVAGEAIAAHVRSHAWDKAVLFNNAGMIEPIGPLAECPPAVLAANLTLNLVAPMVLMQAFIQASTSIARCAVVNISSGAGRRPLSGWAAYCAGKAGLDMASRVAALEAEASGRALTITSIAPGSIDTAMQDVIRGASREAFPDVEHFRGLKTQGTLQTAEGVADRILALLEAGKLPAGLADLRELSANG